MLLFNVILAPFFYNSQVERTKLHLDLIQPTSNGIFFFQKLHSTMLVKSPLSLPAMKNYRNSAKLDKLCLDFIELNTCAMKCKSLHMPHSKVREANRSVLSSTLDRKTLAFIPLQCNSLSSEVIAVRKWMENGIFAFCSVDGSGHAQNGRSARSKCVFYFHLIIKFSRLCRFIKPNKYSMPFPIYFPIIFSLLHCCVLDICLARNNNLSFSKNLACKFNFGSW